MDLAMALAMDLVIVMAMDLAMDLAMALALVMAMDLDLVMAMDLDLVMAMDLVMDLVMALAMAMAMVMVMAIEADMINILLAASLWNSQWTPYIEQHVTDTMINSDPWSICPRYDRAHGREEWAEILKAIAYAESDYNPMADTTESFIDYSTGKLAVSEGLFQLSEGDRAKYGCGEGDLHNPWWSMDCAIKIMTSLIERWVPQETVREALARYWSTLRDNENWIKTNNKLEDCHD